MRGSRPVRQRPHKPSLAGSIPAPAIFFLFFIMVFPQTAFAVTEEEAVRCIMGEARGESFEGKVAVGEIIRRRGSTEGLYGCKAKFKEPKRVWDEARRAWRLSERTKTTKDATLFENTKAFGFPKKWNRKKVQFVTKIDNHDFFKKEAIG